MQNTHTIILRENECKTVINYSSLPTTKPLCVKLHHFLRAKHLDHNPVLMDVNWQAFMHQLIYFEFVPPFIRHVYLMFEWSVNSKLHVIGCFTSLDPWALWLSIASLGGSTSTWSNDGGRHAKVRGKVSFSVGVPSGYNPSSDVDLVLKSSQYGNMELPHAVLRLLLGFRNMTNFGMLEASGQPTRSCKRMVTSGVRASFLGNEPLSLLPKIKTQTILLS